MGSTNGLYTEENTLNRGDLSILSGGILHFYFIFLHLHMGGKDCEHMIAAFIYTYTHGSKPSGAVPWSFSFFFAATFLLFLNSFLPLIHPLMKLDEQRGRFFVSPQTGVHISVSDFHLHSSLDWFEVLGLGLFIFTRPYILFIIYIAIF